MSDSTELNSGSIKATDPEALQKRGRTKMLGLMALYAAPLLLAWMWFAYVSMNEGAGVSVHGELIHPAVPLELFELAGLQREGEDQDVFNLDDLRGKWSMVYFSEAECDQQCESTLYNMRQVRLSTGRRMVRVQRVFVTSEWQNMQKKLEAASEGLHVVGGGNISSLRQQFDSAQVQMTACSRCIYLVDPYGNLMMRFPPDIPPAKMLKDLKHLLKISRIG